MDGSWLKRFGAVSNDGQRAMLEAAGLAQGWDMISEAAGDEVALEWLRERIDSDSACGAVLLAEVRGEIQSLLFRLKPKVAALGPSTEADRLERIVAALERMFPR